MKTSNKRRLTCITLAAALLIALTTPDSHNVSAAKKARLATKKLNIIVGSKMSIKIKNKNKKAKYTYSSNKPKIASVSKKGIITGKTKGSAKVTVKEKLGKKVRNVGIIRVTVKIKENISATATPVIATNTPAVPNNTTITNAPEATAAATTAPTAVPTPLPTKSAKTSTKISKCPFKWKWITIRKTSMPVKQPSLSSTASPASA